MKQKQNNPKQTLRSNKFIQAEGEKLLKKISRLLFYIYLLFCFVFLNDNMSEMQNTKYEHDGL